jgi:Calcineurin-like phosphoesterase
MQKPITHLVIPDVQAKEGNDFTYLRCLGNFIVQKKVDTIICIGDFSDMESLSTYDRGLKSFEGRSYQKDVWAAREAMDALLTPLFEFNAKAKKNKEKQYKPRMVLTLGNHENRINRAINEDRKLDGLISTDDLPYQDWQVIPFLEVITIDGIAYSHYFTSGVMGRPITTANALLTKKHMSCFAGHQQGRQIAYGRRADGKEMTAIIAGSFYEHEENYLGAQGNQHWRGFYVLHDVHDGAYDEMAVSIKFLKERYNY